MLLWQCPFSCTLMLENASQEQILNTRNTSKGLFFTSLLFWAWQKSSIKLHRVELHRKIPVMRWKWRFFFKNKRGNLHQNEPLILPVNLLATWVITFEVFIFAEYLICLLICAVLSVTYVILCLEYFLMVHLNLLYVVIIDIYLIHSYHLKVH